MHILLKQWQELCEMIMQSIYNLLLMQSIFNLFQRSAINWHKTIQLRLRFA